MCLIFSWPCSKVVSKVIWHMVAVPMHVWVCPSTCWTYLRCSTQSSSACPNSNSPVCDCFASSNTYTTVVQQGRCVCLVPSLDLRQGCTTGMMYRSTDVGSCWDAAQQGQCVLSDIHRYSCDICLTQVCRWHTLILHLPWNALCHSFACAGCKFCQKKWTEKVCMALAQS